MEYPVIRIAASQLDFFEFDAGYGPAIYEVQWNGIQFEFLIHWKKEWSGAVVFGNGAVDRKESTLPVFQRNSWNPQIHATTIYYTDPTMRMTDTAGLLWCYGNNDDWYLERIARLLVKILDRLEISLSKTLFFGSSMGGFTSIALATLLGGRAMAINPQLIVPNFVPWCVQRMKEVCLREGEELIPERVDVAKLARREGWLPRLHLILNRASEEDWNAQFYPFCEELRKLEGIEANLTVHTYYHQGGHGGQPPMEQCIQSIHEEMVKFTPPPFGSAFFAKYSPVRRKAA